MAHPIQIKVTNIEVTDAMMRAGVAEHHGAWARSGVTPERAVTSIFRAMYAVKSGPTEEPPIITGDVVECAEQVLAEKMSTEEKVEEKKEAF